MTYYERIDVSESIGINKKRRHKQSIICHYWYFLDKGFSFQQTITAAMMY